MGNSELIRYAPRRVPGIVFANSYRCFPRLLRKQVPWTVRLEHLLDWSYLGIPSDGSTLWLWIPQISSAYRVNLDSAWYVLYKFLYSLLATTALPRIAIRSWLWLPFCFKCGSSAHILWQKITTSSGHRCFWKRFRWDIAYQTVSVSRLTRKQVGSSSP